MRAVSIITFFFMVILFGDSVRGSEENIIPTSRNQGRGSRRSPDLSSHRRLRNPPIEGRGGPDDIGRSTSVHVGFEGTIVPTIRNRRHRQADTRHQGSPPSQTSSSSNPGTGRYHQTENQAELLENLELEMRRRGIISDNPEENLAFYRRLTSRGPPHHPRPRPTRADAAGSSTSRPADTPRPGSGMIRRGIQWLYRQMEYLHIPGITFYTERGSTYGEPPRNIATAAATSRVPPARMRNAEDAHQFPLGTIVAFRNFYVIIIMGSERDQVTYRMMTNAERRIFGRIVRRRPTHPSDYRITPVYYEFGDRLVGPARPPRRGIAQYGECVAAGIMSNIISDDPAVFGRPIGPRNNFLLFRSTRQYVAELDDFILDHVATFTDNMWVHVDLLPTDEERVYEERQSQRGRD